MKQSVCIIFENDEQKFLLLLRDNKPSIPYPNQWDTLGGAVEAGESPEHAIIREMREELELDLKDFRVFRVFEWPEKVETVFYKRLNLDINTAQLHEGQRLRWFSKEELLSLDLAFHDNEVIREFFKQNNNIRSFHPRSVPRRGSA